MSALDVRRLVEALTDHGVDFVIIGGMALVARGSAHVTTDLDICYARNPGNLERLVAAVAPLRPRLRGAPPGLPFRFDKETLRAGLNFTLVTDAGDLDLLGEVTGLGGYEQIAPQSERVEIYDRSIQLMSLDQLEAAKRAAGRRKDLLALEEIDAIRRLQRERGGDPEA